MNIKQGAAAVHSNAVGSRRCSRINTLVIMRICFVRVMGYGFLFIFLAFSVFANAGGKVLYSRCMCVKFDGGDVLAGV